MGVKLDNANAMTAYIAEEKKQEQTNECLYTGSDSDVRNKGNK